MAEHEKGFLTKFPDRLKKQLEELKELGIYTSEEAVKLIDNFFEHIKDEKKIPHWGMERESL